MDMTKYEVGSRVIIRLFDGRELPGAIKRIDETVAGRKVHVRVLFMALKLNAEQIIEVLE
jgi:hypothetical protein